MNGRLGTSLFLCCALVVAAGCRVPLALVADLPESASTLTVRTRVEQVFYADADGLTAVQLKLNLPASFGPGERPSLGGGGILRVEYAAELDPRYPDADFFAWPASQGWIGELVPGRVVEQTFLSRYPNLDGITLRVGTYGADVGQGIGYLRADRTAIVREAPIAGRELTTLAGGATVEVLGSREGWIRVRLSDGRVGYVDRALFDRLPPPVRENRGVLVLRLFAVDGAVPLRETRVDVRGLSDESHVTFSFAPVPDSYQVEYRFTVEAIDTESGRAVTLWGDPATGNLVFRPNYAPVVLAEASLDSGRWSGVQQTLEVRFPPISPTRETYLRLVIEARERPLIVHWSQVRPPGGLPLRSADDPGIWGGLVFNARFVDAIPVSAILRSGIARAVHLFAVDPPLLVAYSIVTVAVLASIAWSWRNGGRRAISP